MHVEFLGTGGATTIPRPGCSCRVCTEARLKGVPYSRSGPSVFVHGPDILIDTPEEIKVQLNRSRVTHIAAGTYSHWHPDHVMGRRVWEELNQDWRGWPRQVRTTPIYLPQQVAEDFKSRLGSWEHLAFLEHQRLVSLHALSDGDSVVLNGVRIEPFRLAEDYVYAFLFHDLEADRRVLIAPDELHGWTPPDALQGVDLAILPMGMVEIDPLSGQRKIASDHPLLRHEATFAQTLEIVGRLRPGRAILTHIEEMDGLTYDDLLSLQPELQRNGLPVEFAHDTMLVDLN